MPTPEGTVTNLAAPVVSEFARPRRDMLDFLLGEAIRSFFLLEYLPELGSVGSSGPDGQRWWAIEDGAAVRGVVTWRPPYAMHLSPMSSQAAQAFARFFQGSDRCAPCHAVQGPLEVVHAFRAVLGAAGGWRRSFGLTMYAMAATDLVLPLDVPGRLRPATLADLPTVAPWTATFCDLYPDRSPKPAELAGAMIADGSLHVWEVGGAPVSMAIRQPPVHGIVHVSAGYTPPAHRRHGYTSACVGELCALALAGGATHCFGMVDTANAAANAAYRGIGYRSVQSVLEIVR